MERVQTSKMFYTQKATLFMLISPLMFKVNPFTRREIHDRRSLLTYRILTLSTWILVVVLSAYYSFSAPPNGRTIWGQSKAHPTPFSLNSQITSAYWIILLLSQLGYIYFLSAFKAVIVNAAANVGSHYILNNLLQAAFILLWVHGRFWIGEIILVINFINLTSLYFRHIRTPRFVHYPIVAEPLCLTSISLLTNGFIKIPSPSLPARIFAHIALCCILIYGLFFLTLFKDYAIGWQLSILCLSLAVQQFHIKVISLQWIFALVVTVVLVLVTMAFAIPPLFGRELVFFREVDDVDVESLLGDGDGDGDGEGEERPLLDDE